ncbi:hypothetical protein M758_3G257200 [Ceratodon purpureus]|nr:hypothetical protein M758_3G257200 [Ceratodon purpureus]
MNRYQLEIQSHTVLTSVVECVHEVSLLEFSECQGLFLVCSLLLDHLPSAGSNNSVGFAQNHPSQRCEVVAGGCISTETEFLSSAGVGVCDAVPLFTYRQLE